MFRLFKREVRDEQTEEVEMFETWIVDWMAHEEDFNIRRYGVNSRVQKQAFPGKDSAKKFAKAIKDAGKLTKTDHDVKVYRQKYD